MHLLFFKSLFSKSSSSTHRVEKEYKSRNINSLPCDESLVTATMDHQVLQNKMIDRRTAFLIGNQTAANFIKYSTFKVSHV